MGASRESRGPKAAVVVSKTQTAEPEAERFFPFSARA
jgi:hypothetical protein